MVEGLKGQKVGGSGTLQFCNPSILRTCILGLLLALSDAALAGNPKWEFWSEQRKGANCFNAKVTEAWFEAAAGLGLEFVRLTPDWWKKAERDFLLGNASNFKRINEADFAELKRVLDLADRHGVKIVLSMVSLPGARNRQHNNNKFDYRLWADEKYQAQARKFWRELAGRLKDHPAIIAYNPLNEPHGERKFGLEGENAEKFAKWYAEKKGTTWDLNRFNRRIVGAIREADPATPILLDCWFHAGPSGFGFLDPVDDPLVLYSFHVYEPWNFTTWRVNKERYSYPEKMPKWWDGPTEAWTKATLRERVGAVMEWQKRHRMPATRVVVGEFGCDRRVGGARQYLADWIELFNAEGWHWAFYAYREDKWLAMDYELGTGPVGWDYWKAKERGEDPEPPRRDNALWEVIKREFK